MTRFRQSIREAILILALAVVLGFVYTGFAGRGVFAPATPAAPATASQDKGSTFLTYEQAAEYFAAGTAVFIDARHAYDYNLGHIKGAVNLPLSEFDDRTAQWNAFAKNALLITYCDGEECNSSIELATKLLGAGFTNVKVFFGGWNQWKEHHREIEASPAGGGSRP